MGLDNRTIFAPATMVGESGITVIRISGPDAFSIISKIFSGRKDNAEKVKISNFHSQSAHLGYIFDRNDLIDEAVITVFKAPNSFTGEDVVEVSSHGGIYIYHKISSLLVRLGVEHAGPGEFSKRAYLNGKLDLVQAEAIADLIRARTEHANILALKQLSGELSTKIKLLKEDLINYCSLLELELDFSEEGIDLVSRKDLLEKIENLIEKFKNLTKTYESGKILKDGVNLAIVGKPNVGKSSIFNYFLKENRAIVSDIPGTTRDFLQEPLIMSGIQFNLIDTAGIREARDSLEKEGVRRSRIKINESDIVLEVDDLTAPELSSEEYVIGVPEEKIIHVYNKYDLAKKTAHNGLCLSAITGENMHKLQEAIVQKARSLVKDSETSDIIITNQRHRDCLLKSCEYLVSAKDQINQSGGNELISFEIRAAMDALTEITGKTTNVDILNNIFSKFCIGK